MSVLIKGGKVVTSTSSRQADVFISGERIERIGQHLDVEAGRTIDARGKLVIPGGVDGHTHMESEAFGTVTADEFTSGTIAAVHGGTTTIIDMAAQYPGFGIEESVERWHEKMRRCPPVADVGFHLILTDLDDAEPGRTFDDLGRLRGLGITSVKVFLAYKGAVMVDDETLFRLMQYAAAHEILVLVHAENGHVVQILTEQLLAEGRTEPRWHADSRPPLVEAEATARAIYFARLAGAPLYVVHVSCAEAVEPIAAARAKKWRVVGETCPQYLFTDVTDLNRPDFSAAKFVFTPPPREAANQDLIWDALRDNALSVVSSDHSTWNYETQKTLGRSDFSKIPNGAPGVEERLMLIFDGGVRTGRITANRFVDIVSTTPAKLFGLYPKKGELAEGSDADIVVWDPERATTLSAEDHHTKTDYNLFEGRDVVGGPSHVLMRGSVIVEDGQLVVDPGHGRFLKRGTTSL
jgi:dihydropyrimidinase